MLATVLATTLYGLEARVVRVEVESSRGPGSFDLVGLAEASVRESRVRIRSALAQLGVLLEEHRVVVNLAPGDLRKSGSAFDLAIAIGTLAALGHVQESTLEGVVLLGELSLTGELRPVRGVLPQIASIRAQGFTRAIVPVANGAEAAAVRGVTTLMGTSLPEIVACLRDEGRLPVALPASANEPSSLAPDLAEVCGQHAARRGLEIAAAGHHHLLVVGPPGGGKTMLARRLPGILPPFAEDEALEASAVHSVAGLLSPERGLLSDRPFRAPHHTVSSPGLVGGGTPVRPGELSLAHHGVLFLDELAEFRRSTLETLRQPLEDGVLVVARASGSATFPAQPLVVCASNPCPCGYYRDGSGRCSCSADRVRNYLARLSGPLVDRLDVHLVLPPVSVASLSGETRGEPSAAVRARVTSARALQAARHREGRVVARTNATLGPSDLDAVASPDDAGRRLLGQAAERLGLSARAFAKVRRLARTIADLSGDESVRAVHVAEAIGLRLFDRGIASATVSAA